MKLNPLQKTIKFLYLSTVYFISSCAFNLNVYFARALIYFFVILRPRDNFLKDIRFIMNLSKKVTWPLLYYKGLVTKIHDASIVTFFEAKKVENFETFKIVADRTVDFNLIQTDYGKLMWRKAFEQGHNFLEKFIKYAENRFPKKRISILTIVPIAQIANSYVKIKDKKEFSFKEPKIIQKIKSERVERRVFIPEQFFALIEDVEITKGFQLRKENYLIHYEDSADLKTENVAGLRHHFSYVGTSADNNDVCIYIEESSGKVPVYIDEAILISSRATENYFHWLIEYLPRLKNVPEHFPSDIPILVKDNLPAQFYEALNILAKDRPVLKIDPFCNKIYAKKIWVPSFHTYHPEKFDIPFYHGGAISIEHLNFVRESTLREVEGLEKPERQVLEKIYLDRIGSRSITNNDEVRKILFKFGIVSVYPETLSFYQQVQLFKNAKIIIGPAGAAFSNMIFCRDAKVIALIAQRNENYVLQCNISEFAGADFYHFTGVTDEPRESFIDEESYVHASFSINIEELKMALKQVLKLSETNL